MNKTPQELNLIGCYIGDHNKELFIVDKQKTLKYPFSFHDTIVKWEDAYFRPARVRGMFGIPTSYRFERITLEEVNGAEVTIIDSSVIDNAVIVYENTSPDDESIQHLSVGGLDFILKDYLGDEEEFYAYYHFAD